MTDDSIIDAAVAALHEGGVALEPGLDQMEFRAIEERLSIQFSPDHRALLSRVLPIGDGFPNWRNGTYADLRRRLDWPFDGVRWDVEYNGFWPRSWGRYPLMKTSRSRAVDRNLAAVPQLIPVFGHRFLPAGNAPSGVPVLSVMQTDVVVYGWNLLDYLRRELGLPRPAPPQRSVVIPFWGELAMGEPFFTRKGTRFRNLSIEGTTLLPPGVEYRTERR